MSDIESLNLTLLKKYLDDSQPRYQPLRDELLELSTLQHEVLPLCAARGVACAAVPATDTHITNMITNHNDANDIYGKLIEMGSDGTSFSSADLEAALGPGALDGPADLEIEPNTLYGMPPHSGYMDDPICAANGNFVHIDTDLETPGFGHVTDVVRTYNSLAAADRTARGFFGWGWSSTIDMRLDLGAVTSSPDTSLTVGTVRAVLADGGSVYFTADEDGAFAPNDPRQLRLQRVAGGWVLRRREDQAWTFNESGELTGGRHQLSTWLVTRSAVNDTATSLKVTEVNSQRSVRYLMTNGLVQTVAASDGRQLEYQYEDGHCTRAVRAIGDVTYEIVDDLVETIRDADGVLICTNDYDAEGRTMGQLSPFGRHTSYEYLPNRVTRVSDPVHGRTNVFIHDRQGNLTAMFDGLGASMRQSWDRRNRATEVVDRAGSTTRFIYADGPEDLLLERIDADGLGEVREYDELHRVSRQVDRAGGVREWHYDGESRMPHRIVEPNGGEIRIQYDDRGLPVSVTDPDGVRTDWMWDNDGQAVAMTNAVGERTVHIYDATGQRVRTIDPMGRQETLVRDEAGRVVTHTSVEGRTEHITFTAAGRAVKGTVEGPGSWSATFGNHGRMDSVTDAVGSTVRFNYDDVGQMIEAIAPDGLTHRLEYDNLGQLVAAVGPTGLRSTQKFDPAGRVVAFTDVEGNTLHRELDELGRSVRVTDPLGGQTTWGWHPNGETAHHTVATGETFSFEVDEMGRVTAQVGPDGSRTTNTWSLAGRLIETTTAAGRTSTWSYDPAGRLTTHTNADGAQTHFALRGDDQVGHIIAPQTVTTLRYNAAGEAVESYTSAGGPAPQISPLDDTALRHAITVPGQASSIVDLDARGLVARVSDPAGIITEFSRDARGRLVGAQTGDQAQHLSWTDTGTMESLTDPLGQVKTWSHSPGGHLMGVQWDDGLGRMLQRDAGGRVNAITTPTGIPLATFTFDALGHLTSATNEHGVVSASVDHDGLVHTTTGLAGDEATYVRDADGVLMQRRHSTGTWVAYTRSEAGNVLGLIDSEIGAVELPTPAPPVIDHGGRKVIDHVGRSFRYDVAGRIESATGLDGSQSHFTWNDMGLLATDTTEARGRRSFAWDAASQLTGTVDEHGHRVVFDYDVVGRRISEHHSDGSSVRFEWNDLDQLERIHRTDSTGQTLTREVTWSGFNRPEKVDHLAISWDDAITNKPVQIGERRWLRAGRFIREATAHGEWHDGTVDDPWGDGGPTGITLGYRGELSVDGLIFMGARVYDPATRTFLSRDPLPAVMGTNAFAGLYVYAWNDPINFVDPTGLRPLTETEFEEHLAERERTRWGSAVERARQDPLGTILLVTVLVVGTVLLVPPASGLGVAVLGIGAGMVIGAGATAAIGIHNKDFNPSSAAVNGIVGGATGALGPLSWGAQVAGGAAFAASGNVLTQGLDPETGLTGMVTDGEFYEEGWEQFNFGEVVASGIGGGLIPPGLGPGLGNRAAAVGLGMAGGGVSDGLMQWAQDPGPWHDMPDLNWTSIGTSSVIGGVGEGVAGRTAGGHTDFGPNRTHPNNVRAEWGTDQAVAAQARADEAHLNNALHRMDLLDEVAAATPGTAAYDDAMRRLQQVEYDLYESRHAVASTRRETEYRIRNEVDVTAQVAADGQAGIEPRRTAAEAVTVDSGKRDFAMREVETYESVVDGWQQKADGAATRTVPDHLRTPPPPSAAQVAEGPTLPDEAVTAPAPANAAPEPSTSELSSEFPPARDTEVVESTPAPPAPQQAQPPRDPAAGMSDPRAGLGNNGEIIQMAP